jgi:hypothetical protein
MHVQAKSAPALSPADLEAFLRVLGDVNIEGVTGSALEDGGEFVFAVQNGREADAHERLTGAGYKVQWTADLYHERIPPTQGSGGSQDVLNQAGVLLGIIERAKQSVGGNRAIDTILVGAFTAGTGRFYCQCTWTDATWQSEPPDVPEEEED